MELHRATHACTHMSAREACVVPIRSMDCPNVHLLVFVFILQKKKLQLLLPPFVSLWSPFDLGREARNRFGRARFSLAFSNIRNIAKIL